MHRWAVRSGDLPQSRFSGVMLTGLAGTTTALADAGINILMNQAKILKLSRPADTIIIGNPEIADGLGSGLLHHRADRPRIRRHQSGGHRYGRPATSR